MPRLRDANWDELAKKPDLKSPIIDRTFGPEGPVYKPGRPPLTVANSLEKGLTAKFESIIHVCVVQHTKSLSVHCVRQHPSRSVMCEEQIDRLPRY